MRSIPACGGGCARKSMRMVPAPRCCKGFRCTVV
nr:MAG TPA: hypothetical protein [Caudoviricetes sp.]